MTSEVELKEIRSLLVKLKEMFKAQINLWRHRLFGYGRPPLKNVQQRLRA